MEKIKKHFKLIISIILILLWAGIIFIFSAMDGEQSNSKSRGTIDMALTKAAEVSNDLGVTDVNTQSAKKIPIINLMNKLLRKCMHAGVFFVLAILLCNILKQFKISNKKVYLITIILVFLYACIDEYHQTFVPRKNSESLEML